MLDQLPHHDVEFIRSIPPYSGGPAAAVGSPDKIFRASPGPGGTVTFRVEFDQEGAADQSNGEVPLEVTVQLGEFTVMKELLRTSVPILIGWSTLIEFAVQRNTAEIQGANDFPNAGGSMLPF